MTQEDLCPRAWELDAIREQRLGPKDIEAMQRHIRVCASCAAACDRDRRLRTTLDAWAREMEPSELGLRRLRGRVLHDAAAGPSGAAPAWRQAAMAVGVLLVLAGAVRVGLHATDPAASPLPALAPSAPELRGEVRGDLAARWSQRRDGAVERVRLEAGAIHVRVPPEGEGERFLVELPDGVIEVRGATLQVIASAAATERVDVEEGSVVLQLAGRPEVTLHAGAGWFRDTDPSP